MRKKANLIVSNRGQITLPAEIRQRFALHEGSVVTLEERPNELILRPATILEVDTYTEADIAAWEAADKLTKDEKAAIRTKIARKR